MPEKFALIHSEVSEAYEAYRHQIREGKDGYAMEMGDIVSRSLHLCGILGIDVEQEITSKLNLNKDRKWDWSKMNEGHS